MGESRHLVTRREILKRGAIVGGGVLWVAPIIQTLGMGPAYAADVSGPAPCVLTLTYTCYETIIDGGPWGRFHAFPSPGCACNHDTALLSSQFSAHDTPIRQEMTWDVDHFFFEFGEFFVYEGGFTFTAECFNYEGPGTPGTGTESNTILFLGCLP